MSRKDKSLSPQGKYRNVSTKQTTRHDREDSFYRAGAEVTVAPPMLSPADLLTPEELDVRWRLAVRDRLAAMDLRLTGPVERLGSAEELDLGDLLITDWVCAQVEGTRDRNAVRQDDDALLLLAASAGRQIIETADETVVLRPGTVLIMSTRTTGRFVIPDHLAKRTVRVPMSALSPFGAGGGAPGCLLLDAAQNPLANLLHGFLMSMDRHIGRMSAAEVEGARNALLALIAGMIRASRAHIGDDEFLHLLRRRLEDWIIDHLAGGPVRVADLAAAHSVSPRTVHRAFASTGDTVGAVIRMHRLAAARGDLVNTNLCIAAIAHRWGFCDASHFGREFRREFSLSPGDYREAHGCA
ncbi:AraC family transcriptional regulator [Streptomyces sp. AK08-02]|uniref:helix-turn-helix transcriptional regulator n=1 Tax=Streptomyces sp. AK08-02 TaxID=3028654 RepID=UPI0029B0EA7C|nr:AraC family transcriptional regulator [Streptomyces sp. AK08-02]MDX3748441.1 AraC family transcriptional regulator [Streptomyces sp. AK08-02]